MPNQIDEQIESTSNSQSMQNSSDLNEVHKENNGIKTSDRDTEISQNPKENTRRIIASLYVWAFFAIIFITLVIGILNNYSVDDYKDILVTVSGILSGPLGFIVGYYFKATSE